MKNPTPLFLFPIFLFLLTAQAVVAQTNYTWNGSVDNSWNNASNWTPAGSPGSMDNVTIDNATRYPTLSANDTVNNFTLTDDTLDLNGYRLLVNGAYSITDSRVTAGQFHVVSSGASTIQRSLIESEVSSKAGGQPLFIDSEFTDSVYVLNTYWGGFGVASGGNVFHDRFFLEHNGWLLYFGYAKPDTFEMGLRVDVIGTGSSSVILGYSSNGSYSGGDVILNNTGSGSYPYIHLGNASYPNNLFTVDGNIIISCTTTNTTSGISLHEGVRTTSGSQVLIGAGGFDHGVLTIGLTQLGADLIDLEDMTGSAELVFDDCELAGHLIGPDTISVAIQGASIFGSVNLPNLTGWAGARFNGKADIVTLTSTGGNVFMDTVSITAANIFRMGNSSPDSCFAPLTVHQESNSYSVDLCFSSVGNYFANDVTLNCQEATSRGFNIGNYITCTGYFGGDIIMNMDSSSVGVSFNKGTYTHNGRLVIGPEGFHSGKLKLAGYTQTGSGTNVLAMDNGADLEIASGCVLSGDLTFEGDDKATITGATFQGDVSISAHSLSIVSNTFEGTTHLEKTGNGYNNLNGGNRFEGTTTLENSTASNYVYWGGTYPDTVLGDLTLINRSSYALWMNYNTVGSYAGDIIMDGDSACIIRFGGTIAGREAIFNGSSDQRLACVEDDLNVQLYRIGMNKSGGRFKVYDDVTVYYDLSLTDGIIEMLPSSASGNASVLTINDGVTPTASDNSYVEGAVKKIGNDAFTFPVGRNGHYRPIGISAPSNATHAFTAEYFESNSDWINSHSSRDTTLDNLSTNEYWTLTRDVGTSTPVVTLSWDTITSCTMDTSLSARHIAGWDGSQWDDLGNGGTTGTADAGTVSTSAGVTDFNMFVLESDSSLGCSACQLGAYLGTEDTTLYNIYIDSEPVWYSFLGSGQEIITIEPPDSTPIAHIDSLVIYRDCHEGQRWVWRTDTVGSSIQIDTLFDVGVDYFVQIHGDTSGYFNLSMRGGQAACSSIATFHHVQFSDTLQNYGLQEVVVDLTACYYNPYDYEQVELRAKFYLDEDPSHFFFVDGFYMEPCTYDCSNGTELTGSSGTFHVRFTPDRVGSWSFHLICNDMNPLHGYSSTYNFEVTDDPDAKGFVQMNPQSKFLTYSATKETYIPIGVNVGWLSTSDGRVICRYEDYFDEFFANGIDNVRILLNSYWAFDIEATAGDQVDVDTMTNSARWNQVNYDVRNYHDFQDRAFEFDQILELAKDRGITIKPCLNTHASYSDDLGSVWTPGHWLRNNPYYQGGNGYITPADPVLVGGVVMDQTAQLMDAFDINGSVFPLMKNRHRYVVARWGYATNLQSWQIFNENYLMRHMHDSPDLREVMLEWNAEICSLIDEWDPYGHLISTSNVDPGDPGLAHDTGFYKQLFDNIPELDFSEIHSYNGGNPDSNYFNDVLQEIHFDGIFKFTKLPNKLLKPTIVDEFGFWGGSAIHDPNGFDLHHTVWANVCGGALGSGMPWWWRYYLNAEDSIMPGDLWHIFKGISVFRKHVSPYLKQYPTTIFQTRDNGFDHTTYTPEQVAWFAGYNDHYRWTYSQNKEITFGHVQRDIYDWRTIYQNNYDYLMTFDQGDKPTMDSTGSSWTLTLADSPSMFHGVTWYNTETGIPFAHNLGTTNSSGELTVTLPVDDENEQFRFGDAAFIVLPCGQTDQELGFDEGTETLHDHFAQGNIIVDDGASLTITGTVAFPPGTGIYVYPGGKLIVDGGKLTSSCDYMWKGIRVYGTHNQEQSANVGGHQGVVELKNGAIIEHAKIGIDLIDQLTSAQAGGGVIQAEDATIRNCAKGVAFGPYRRPNGGNNISYFKNVSFLCDQPMNDPSYNGNGTGQFVSLWGVRNVRFTDCVFEFDHDNPAFNTALPLNRWPTGITSHYAGYRLEKGSGSGNLFKNLQWGLYGFDLFTPQYKIHSSNSTFENVYKGAFLAGTYYPVLADNTFQVPNGSFANGATYGFMGNWNSKYRLRGNAFSSMETSAMFTWGAVINGTYSIGTPNGGRLYGDNTFDNLAVAFQAEESNSYLDISCNDFDSCAFDWILNPITEGLLADQGVSCPQVQGGTDGTRAGNTFTNGQQYNIYEQNLLDQPRYYAAGGVNSNTVPVSYNQSSFFVDVENCQMLTTDPTCASDPLPPIGWEVKRFENQQQWNVKLAELDSVVAHLDSSQTQLLLDTIANLNTNDTLLTTVLLAHSPLSDEVLEAYMERDTIKTEDNFREVMLKNLPVAKPVWEALVPELEKLKDPDVRDTLYGAQAYNPLAVTTTSLNREIRYHSAETHRAADEYVLYYMDNDSLDFVKPYMDTVNLYPLRLALLGAEISDDNWDEADSSLAKLPLTTMNDTAIYDLYAMFIDLGRDTLSLLDISGTDSLRVRQIAADTTLDASIIAKGMLGVMLDTMFRIEPEPFDLPSERRGQEDSEETLFSPTETSYFKAFPNPFNGTVTIEYRLTEDCDNGCTIRLTDMLGRTVKETALTVNNGQGSMTVDMNGYGSGLYLCSLYNDRRLLQTARLLKTRE